MNRSVPRRKADQALLDLLQARAGDAVALPRSARTSATAASISFLRATRRSVHGSRLCLQSTQEEDSHGDQSQRKRTYGPSASTTAPAARPTSSSRSPRRAPTWRWCSRAARPSIPGKGMLFVTPDQGREGDAAAQDAGMGKPAEHLLGAHRGRRQAGPRREDRAHARRSGHQLPRHDAIAIGRKFVSYIACDSADDAARAIAALEEGQALADLVDLFLEVAARDEQRARGACRAARQHGALALASPTAPCRPRARLPSSPSVSRFSLAGAP